MVDKNESNTTFVVNETSRPNSFETGPAGKRLKIYFSDAEDLKKQLNELTEINVYDGEAK